MRRLQIQFVVFAVGLFAVPVKAQTIPSGVWSGTITPPNEATVQVTYDVRSTADSTAILLKSPFGDFQFYNLRILPDRITFAWSPGPEVTCSLARKEDGSYSGACTDADGSSGTLVMQPPGAAPSPFVERM
ncbi:MAG: hypothetical protein L0271_21720 [Gemmatimonadetes bacterium]|nr:hypothetical protein [Gemmatimonadota bacterium]